MEGLGDFTKAIELFNKLVKEFPKEKAVAAKALLQLGICYEKLGKAEARMAYERLIREYSDQHELVAAARTRLARLARPEHVTVAPAYRYVYGAEGEVLDWHPMRVAEFDFSPDGREFVFRERSAEGARLLVRDVNGTETRPLLKDPGSRRGFHMPRWSPDGKSIAFFASSDDMPGLYVVGVDGLKPRHVFSGAATDVCWTPDSRALTYTTSEDDSFRVYVVRVEDGHVERITNMKGHWSVRLGGYSRDGKWLAYQEWEAGRENYETDIWILPVQGGDAHRLTFSPGWDANPAWTPDGRTIYFVSARGVKADHYSEYDDANVWRLRVDPAQGTAVGEPERVTTFQDARIMFPRVVAEGNELGFALLRTTSIVKVAKTAHPEDAKTLGRGGPHMLISPDGQTVYFVGEGPDQRGIYAVSVKGGTPRQLTYMGLVGAFDLSPDGQRIVFYSDEARTPAIYSVSTAGGEPQLVVQTEKREPYLSPRWSPDGEWIAYTYEDGLYVVTADAQTRWKLTELHRWEGWTIEWSPNGKHIALFGYPAPDEENAVYVVSFPDGETNRLTPAEQHMYKEGLDWHPSGESLTYIYYLPPRGWDSEIRQIFLDGRPARVLVNQPDNWDYVGQWAPDGVHFYFWSMAAEGGGQYVYNFETGEISFFSRDTRVASWSRDGKQIALVTQNVARELWMVEIPE